jgi:Mg2+/Co2+ transporter CorB
MARDTYLAKIVVKKEHLAPTLSLGISINHAVSMSIPTVGGLMWIRYGHASVFLATAVIAVLMGVLSAMVRTPTTGKAIG